MHLGKLRHITVLVSFISLLILVSCTRSGPELEPKSGFAFAADTQALGLQLRPALEVVTPQGTTPPGETRVLANGQDLEMTHFEYEFQANNTLVIWAAFKNITEFNFNQPFFFTVAETTNNIVSSTEPEVTDADLGGDGVLSPGETTSILTFEVIHRGGRFEYYVNANAAVQEEENGGTTVTDTIGNNGGFVRLGDAVINVPSGAVDSSTEFTIEQLSEAPAPLPENREVVASYRFSSTSSDEFNDLIQIVIPVDPTSLPDEQVIVELYTWDGSDYTKIRISEGTNAFLVEASSLSDQTFVAGRAEKATLENDCAAKGGVFNGVYCQLPFPDDSSNGQSLTTQAASDYKVLSINVGNIALGYCGKYAVKLCSYAVEENVRNALVQDNPDIIAFQEIWHSDCFFVSEPENITVGPIVIQNPYGDRVCSDTPVQFAEQIERLLTDQNGTSQYTWRCTEEERLPLENLTINGYECVALRKGLFEFGTTLTERPAPIQPPCDPNDADPDEKYAGRDTGFQVESVRLLNPAGPPRFAEFDVVNAHLEGTGPCRGTQLRAFRDRYYQSGQPAPERLLILGDFNIDPLGNTPLDTGLAQDYFNRIFSERDTALDYFLTLRSAYMISDPTQSTQFGRSLDHVLSNFADGSCVRGNNIGGLDHRRTLCDLYGFDSGGIRSLVTLWDTSTSTVNYVPWNVTSYIPIRKGVKLTYTDVENPSVGRYDVKGLPDEVPVGLEILPCRNTVPKVIPIAIGEGQEVGIGEIRFAEFLPICL